MFITVKVGVYNSVCGSVCSGDSKYFIDGDNGMLINMVCLFWCW